MPQYATVYQHTIQDKSAVGNFLFSVANKTYNSPKTKPIFLVVLKSIVPIGIITVSGQNRCLFSITLCSCSVLIPWKHSTISSVCSAAALSNTQSPTTMHFATVFACNESLFLTKTLYKTLHSTYMLHTPPNLLFSILLTEKLWVSYMGH